MLLLLLRLPFECGASLPAVDLPGFAWIPKQKSRILTDWKTAVLALAPVFLVRCNKQNSDIVKKGGLNSIAMAC